MTAFQSACCGRANWRQLDRRFSALFAPLWLEDRASYSAQNRKARSFGSAAGRIHGNLPCEWIGLLRRELARACLELGIGEFDAFTLQRSFPRTLTQRASR